ncbi:hypothetical protein [Myceligenerans crystallogenes]|uniref:PQQ-like domain-containing protein n=1 Tax=Myceligenerans crystallogenes TaxID=316335 RepID=A0ABP4ZM78_9MICO
MRRALALVPVVALLMAGCSWSLVPEVTVSEPPEEEQVAPAEILTGEPVEPVWRLEGKPVGQPVAVDGVVVAIVVARQDEMDVVGIDAKYGDELWRFPYSPGRFGTGEVHPLVTASREEKQYVVFQRAGQDLGKGSGFTLPLVAVDPVSGEKVAESRPLELPAPLRTCPDGIDACVPIEHERDENGLELPSKYLRLDLSGLELREVGPISASYPPGASELAPGELYWRPEAQGPGVVGRMDTADPLWEVPVADAFGEGFSPRFGSSLRYDEENALFYGGLAQGTPADRAAYDQGRTLDVDLGKNVEAGIDAESGEVLWTQEGVSSACGLGARPLAAETLEPGKPWMPAQPVWCRLLGTEQRSKADGWTRSVTKLSIERFDLGTGVAEWTVDVDLAEGDRLLSGDDLGPGEHEVLVAGGRVVRTPAQEWRLVTFADGTQHEIPEGFAFLCKGRGEDLRYGYAVPFEGGSPTTTVAPFPYPCTADGEPTTNQLTRGAVQAGAIDAGSGRYVYATADGLLGYDFE